MHCHLLLLGRGVAMQEIHHLLRLRKVDAGRDNHLVCCLVGPVRV